MSHAHNAVDKAIEEIDRLRRFLKKSQTLQVRSSEEKDVVKANCLTWFNNRRPRIAECATNSQLIEADNLYKKLLSAIDRATSRTRYLLLLKNLRIEISSFRGLVVAPENGALSPTDNPPSFDKLVPDPAMQAILERRWRECVVCVSSGAPLAATVMMGGLLEALLLARVHYEKDKTRIFCASSAPMNQQTGKTLTLQAWTLRHYIDVAHELAWISSSAKDVGAVLRDYRNYIHPEKERTHGIQLEEHDALLFWEISKSITRQVLDSTAL